MTEAAATTEATEAEQASQETTETQSTETTQETTKQETKEQTAQEKDDAVWRDSIKDESLRKFSEQFTTLEDLAKSTLHFRQKLSNAITKPGKDASEEDIKAFHKALGVPESPDGYKIDVPEGANEALGEEDVQSFIAGLAETAHATGARTETVNALVKELLDKMVDAKQEREKKEQDDIAAAEQALRKEYGKDYDVNVQYAKRAFKQFGDEKFLDLIDKAEYQGVALSSHPDFIKYFVPVGRRMGEGGLQHVISADDKKSTEQKINDLTSQAHDAMNAGDRSKADRLFKERDALSQSFYGTQ